MKTVQIKTTDYRFNLLEKHAQESLQTVPWVVRRTEMRRAFKGAENIKGGVLFIYQIEKGTIKDQNESPVEVKLNPKSISIGCQIVSGDNFIRLKKWALAKKK